MLPRPLLRAAIVVLGLTTTVASAADRTFDFIYAFKVTGLRPSQIARVWVPEPPTNATQTVAVLGGNLTTAGRVVTQPDGLNSVRYVEAPAASDGTLPLSITYRITRHEIAAEPVAPGEDLSRDLRADRLVPLGGRPAGLLRGKVLPNEDTAKARVLYDTVYDYLTYSKEKPGWGRGDVLWACDSRAGNCSDFHSLFLSLARTEGLPAKMEIGYLIPTPPRGPAVANYHCWAFFKAADRDAWTPVDISAAKNRPQRKDYYFGNLDANRVAFSTGRDLTLTPQQAGPPLNFLVYPYVEVDGQPWPAEKIVRDFSAKDVLPATRPAE